MAARQQEAGFLMQADEPELETGCACFRGFWSRGQRRAISNGEDGSYLLPETGDHQEPWLVKQVKKLREVSELVAGPKWKNFLRKIGAYFNKKMNKRKDFQYDSYDYALNFDDGLDDEDDEYGGVLGFSSRFAPPLPNKATKS